MRSELSIPAGSLQCALYAFKGGADAVYLGAKQFSARKGAVNFSFEDLRKLKSYCLREGKKFYLTVNTLINDDQLEELFDLLKRLSYIEPDGIIVQDLGVASIIKKRFPNLNLQASTQLAVHTVEGVRELKKLGFSRIVLSRELSFEEICHIRKECPDVELKVFIHGALCYGFSGLCMASQNLTGRSANCGECAQICRTWFSCNETKKDGWFFSMKDLCLGSDIRKLQEIGIESFKVEGRMKSPEYCYWTARYYSLLLDGCSEEDSLVVQAKEAMQVSFSRETTKCFFYVKNSVTAGTPNLVCSDYPSHRGIKVGTIRKVMASSAEICFTEPVALRDGLLVVYGMESAGFALSGLENRKSYVSAGESAIIDFPTKSFKNKPVQGTDVWCTSRHNLNGEKLNENLPLFARSVDIGIEVKDKVVSVNGREYEIDVQQANKDSDITAVFEKVFSASDKSLFTSGSIFVQNSSSFKNPFLPLSRLKEIRRDYYAFLDRAFEEESQTIPKYTADFENLPSRSLLGLWDEVKEFDGKKYICLSPLMFDEEEYFAKITQITRSNPGIYVGLNNIAQLSWARQNSNVPVFADFFLYTSNRFAYNLIKKEIPNLIGSYELDGKTRFTFTGKDFRPPMFVSRVCLRHNGLKMDCKGCSRDNVYNLTQNGKKYKAFCKNCVTIVQMEA